MKHYRRQTQRVSDLRMFPKLQLYIKPLNANQAELNLEKGFMLRRQVFPKINSLPCFQNIETSNLDETHGVGAEGDEAGLARSGFMYNHRPFTFFLFCLLIEPVKRTWMQCPKCHPNYFNHSTKTTPVQRIIVYFQRPFVVALNPANI